jgi:hypothetical protein
MINAFVSPIKGWLVDVIVVNIVFKIQMSDLICLNDFAIGSYTYHLISMNFSPYRKYLYPQFQIKTSRKTLGFSSNASPCT